MLHPWKIHKIIPLCHIRLLKYIKCNSKKYCDQYDLNQKDLCKMIKRSHRHQLVHTFIPYKLFCDRSIFKNCSHPPAMIYCIWERTKVLNQKAALTDAKTQLNTLQVENEDLNLEIEQSIRFDTVETAAKKYGMVKPDSKHTLRYEKFIFRARMQNTYASTGRYQKQTKRWQT